MHLPYLAELADRFELAALCDVSPDVAAAMAARYRVPRTYGRWEDMLAAGGLDAVLVLTSGSHAPIAAAAAEAGLHVFVEKPMALTVDEAAEMVAAARRAGTVLAVGNMKRYDPAAERLRELLPELEDLRLVRVTTLESPLEPYVAHLPLVRPAPGGTPPPEDADETRWVYRHILLDSLVHELNLLRWLLGEPSAVTHAELSRSCVGATLRFGDAPCHLSWVDLPGIARYSQELAFYGPDVRLTLTLPSPFLRNEPTRLVVEGGTPGTASAWAREECLGYEEAFKRELAHFADCIRTGAEPRTTGVDGLRDVALCASLARVHATGMPEEAPTAAPGDSPLAAGDGAAAAPGNGAAPVAPRGEAAP
jgi:predicted dehydrogenase